MADMKKLRVCLSSELPAVLERSSGYLYFTYDKLNLYVGQNDIEENFVIASAIPDYPVPGMIYILDTDGSVHRIIDYSDVQVAEIEDSSQIELLKKAGTLFYINANRRYLDSQKRTFTLPFNDGTYELNVNMKNDQVFDKNTILKYNEEHERFEVYGDQSEEFIDFSKPFRGAKTSSAEINVDSGRISGNIRVSAAVDNILRIVSDGLYAKVNDKIDKSTFDTWKKDVDDFRKYAQNILDNIDAELKTLQQLVTPEKIRQDEMEILSQKFGDIQTALDNYQKVVDSLDSIENEVMTYSSSTIIEASDKLQKELDENSAWSELDAAATSYTQEIDYYAKAEEYYYPTFSTKIGAAITMSLARYLEEEKLATSKAAIILSISKFLHDMNAPQAIISASIDKFLRDESKEANQKNAAVALSIDKYITETEDI